MNPHMQDITFFAYVDGVVDSDDSDDSDDEQEQEQEQEEEQAHVMLNDFEKTGQKYENFNTFNVWTTQESILDIDDEAHSLNNM